MSKRRKKEQRFWSFVHKMHLYESSGEALFKGCGLFVTWCGTILVDVINGTPVRQDTILFFALSIILEYAVQFVSGDDTGTPKQCFTGVLTVANFLVYAMAFMQMIRQIANPDLALLFCTIQIVFSLVSVAAIFADAIMTACEKKPAAKQKKKLETKLKNT